MPCNLEVINFPWNIVPMALKEKKKLQIFNLRFSNTIGSNETLLPFRSGSISIKFQKHQNSLIKLKWNPRMIRFWLIVQVLLLQDQWLCLVLCVLKLTAMYMCGHLMVQILVRQVLTYIPKKQRQHVTTNIASVKTKMLWRVKDSENLGYSQWNRKGILITDLWSDLTYDVLICFAVIQNLRGTAERATLIAIGDHNTNCYLKKKKKKSSLYLYSLCFSIQGLIFSTCLYKWGWPMFQK